MKKTFSFVINRAKWLRPTKANPRPESQLLDAEGKMCCVGIFLRACKMPKKVLLHHGVAADLTMPLPKRGRFLLEEPYNSELAHRLYQTNDRVGISAKTREFKIKSLFARANVAVTFVGRTPRK